MENNTLKSTRLKAAIVIWFIGIYFFVVGNMDAAQWIDLTKWIFGTYSLSEVGSKGAKAYKDANV